MYCWTLTKDHLFNPQYDKKPLVGLCGPRSCKLSHEEIKNHPKGKKFRLVDDDGEVHSEGVFVDFDGKHDGFEPLDDWGEGGTGATIIQYWDHGWRQL